ncbi:hypothetical protein JB92DRAFT_3085091 [Gautieria morchelliformis]|nr:hypothetical protein JB92DRAFT_3085091 [Gautieria morchelliformis]
MWTAQWWWDLQARGATIAPVILASDKTQLSRFSGDKEAWPVYISVGNISKSLRHQTSKYRAYRPFHYCMSYMLKPLIEAGKEGVLMTCADNLIQRVFPILASYLADYPEQCLIACHQENSCPICEIASSDRGDPCFMPVLLHQLHKGVLKDHLVKWCIQLSGAEEVDGRFQALPDHPGLRYFKKGISTISQWTGHEHKEMERVFASLIYGAVPPRVTAMARAVIDFIYYPFQRLC